MKSAITHGIADIIIVTMDGEDEIDINLATDDIIIVKVRVLVVVNRDPVQGIVLTAEEVVAIDKKQSVYLCRHGETEWTLSSQHTSFTDIPLTKRGISQVEFLFQKLQKVSFQQVISSPRLRAIQTCKAAGLVHRAMIDPDASEWNYGKYEGLTTEQIQERHPHWSLFHDGVIDGETIDEVAQRADRLIQKIQSIPGNVALFSHGHFLRIFAARWIQLPPKAAVHFALSVASLSVLGYEREEKVIEVWNQTA